MNRGSNRPLEGVTSSSKVLGFQYGNILHTGGVGGSIPSASTNRPAILARQKNVPLGPCDPKETHLMPKQGQPYPQLDDYDRRRFASKVQRGDLFACWPWKAAKHPKGYGRFKVGGKLYSSHRLAYEMANGPIPEKMVANGLILHACHNPACCNPAHLRLGSGSENVMDAVKAGRWVQGQRGRDREFWKQTHPSRPSSHRGR